MCLLSAFSTTTSLTCHLLVFSDIFPPLFSSSTLSPRFLSSLPLLSPYLSSIPISSSPSPSPVLRRGRKIMPHRKERDFVLLKILHVSANLKCLSTPKLSKSLETDRKG
jgi:hypothetical protein